jgi:hypothetical protein
MRLVVVFALLSYAARLGAQGGVQDATPPDTVSAVVTPDTSEIAPGDAVRITAPALGLSDWHGFYVAAPPDSVTVRGADSVTRSIPLWEISEFLVNHGNRPPQSQWLLGAGIGGLAGAAVGVLAHTRNLDEGCTAEGSSIFECTPEQYRGGLEGAAIGVLVGAGVGALIRITPWQYVPINAPEAAAMATPRGDPVVALRFRF